MVDPRTPVLVGVGQFTERIDDPDYRGLSAVDLATAAAKAPYCTLEQIRSLGPIIRPLWETRWRFILRA